jgi:hypothetical protein
MGSEEEPKLKLSTLASLLRLSLGHHYQLETDRERSRYLRKL